MKKTIVLSMVCLMAASVSAKDKQAGSAEGIYVYDGVYDTVNLTYKERGSQFPVDLIDCSDEQSLCYYSEYSGGIVVPRCGKNMKKGLKRSFLVDELGKANLQASGKNARASVYSFKYTLDNQDWHSIMFYTPKDGLIAKANYGGDLNDLTGWLGKRVKTEKLKLHYAKKGKGMFAC